MSASLGGKVRTAFTAIDREFGRLDLLVNNAAVAWPHSVADATDEQLRSEVARDEVRRRFRAVWPRRGVLL